MKTEYWITILKQLPEQWVDLESRPLSEEEYQELVKLLGKLTLKGESN